MKIQIIHFSWWFNLRIGSSYLGIFCRWFLWSFYTSQIMVLNFSFTGLVIGSVGEQFSSRPVYQVSCGAEWHTFILFHSIHPCSLCKHYQLYFCVMVKKKYIASLAGNQFSTQLFTLNNYYLFKKLSFKRVFSNCLLLCDCWVSLFLRVRSLCDDRVQSLKHVQKDVVNICCQLVGVFDLTRLVFSLNLLSTTKYN